MFYSYAEKLKNGRCSITDVNLNLTVEEYDDIARQRKELCASRRKANKPNEIPTLSHQEGLEEVMEVAKRMIVDIAIAIDRPLPEKIVIDVQDTIRRMIQTSPPVSVTAQFLERDSMKVRDI